MGFEFLTFLSNSLRRLVQKRKQAQRLRAVGVGAGILIREA